MKIAYKKAQYSADKGLVVEEKPKKILNRGAISIETGKPVESYIDNTDDAINRYYNDRAQVYVPGKGFISMSAASDFYTQQRKQAAEENLAARNAVRSTDAYQSARRGAYADSRTRAETPEYQQAKNNAKDYYYQKIAEFENARRIAMESASSTGGMHDAALYTMRQLGEELNEAKANYQRFSNPTQFQKYLDNTPMNQLAAQQRATAASAKPFYVDGMGYVTAKDAKTALQENREVHYMGSGSWGADAGSSDLVDVLEQLNEQNKQNKESAHRQQMQQAYAETGREFRGQTSRLDMTGGLEEDLESAKTAHYNQNAENRALAYEQETLQNDRSAEYKKPLLSASLFGNETGQNIAHNVATGSADSSYSSLNDTERRTILSLAAQERWDDVKEYFDAIDSRVNARVHERRAENIQNASKIAQVGTGLSSTLSAPAAFAQQLGTEVHNAISDDYRPIDLNEGPTSYLRLAQTGQQASLEDLPEWGQFLGNVGYSIAQNAATLPLGPAGAAIWLGASAAGQASTEALESGSTLGQALMRGSAAGVIETATEKLGLDNLFKTAKSVGKTGLKSFLGSVLKQAGAEGTEEAISEFANTIFDIVQMGEDSAYEQRYQELVDSGMSKNEARRRANFEFFAKNPALAAAAGAVSGLLMGGGSTTIQQINSGKANRELASNSTALINAAMNLTNDDGTIKRESDAFQIADQIARDQRYGKKIDNNRYADLAQALEAEGVSVNDAVAAETARQQEAEAARAAKAAADAEEARVRAAQRAPYEQEGARLFRAVAEEENLNVSDSPSVNAAVADVVEEVMNATNVSDPTVLSVMTRAANTIENAYMQALSEEYGGRATVTDDGLDSVRRELTGQPISISRSLEQSNPELYERALSALNVQDGAQSVSMAYSRLQDQTPDAYTADTEAEQLRQMVDIVQNAGQAVELSGLSDSDRVVVEGLANDYAATVIERAISYAQSPEARQAVVSVSNGNVSANTTIDAQNVSQPVRKAKRFTSKHYSDNEIMRNVVDSASAAGVHANVALSISNIAGETHIKTEFQNLGADSGVNGFYDKANGTIVINADVLNGGDYQAATKAAFIIYGHELVHHLESTGYYAQLKKVVLQSAEVKRQLAQWSEQVEKRATFTDLIRMQQRESAKSGQNISLEQAERDYIAQFVAENYLGNPQQLQKVARMNRSLAQQILDWMRKVLRNVKGVHPGHTELEQAHAVLALALDERYTQPDSGEGVQYSLAGRTDNGVEVYETSDEVKSLSWAEKKKRFLTMMQETYRGRTAKFNANGEIYYAKFNDEDLNKNIYGDSKSSSRGWKAKINTGADGGIFDLVENASYSDSKRESGKNIAAHKNVSDWDYFIKTVQIDNRVYDLLANVRKKSDGEFVYSIELRDNKKIAPATSHEPAYNRDSRNGYSSNEMHTEADTSVPPNAASVNTPTSINFGVSSQAELLNRYLEEYGPMLRGERVQHMDGSDHESGTWQAPKQTAENTYTRRTMQTFANAPSLSPADRQIAMEMVDNVGQYVRISNRETVQQAREKRSQYSSFEQAVGAFISGAKDARIKDARVLVAMGQQLLMESANDGHNKQTTFEIMAALADLQTQLGQGVQAASIINKLSPEGYLVAVKRISDKTANLVKKQASKKQQRKNQLDAAAANEAADASEEAAKGIRKMADDIRRGMSDDEINRLIDAIKEDMRRRIQLAETTGGNAENATETLRKLEELQKQREAELNKLADKNNHTKEEIKAARAKLNELNNDLKKAKAQASGAVKRYQDVFKKLDEVKAEKSSGKYQKAVEAFDTAKQAAKDARTFAKYAEENYFAPPKQLMNQLIDAKSESEREDIKHKIVLYMAEQTPGTAAEKVDAWRYFSMLANPKTHLRNVFGNAAMWGARKLRNTMATAIEAAALRNKRDQRTRAFTTRWGDSELYRAARQEFENNRRDISGDPKYSLPGESQEQRRIFGGNFVSDKFETVRQFVGEALEWEDLWFLQPAFESSWAGFVKARGYNVNSMTAQQKAEAFEFAKNEAQVATFKEANTVSELLSKFRQKGGGYKFAADAIMPFTKTPMNILKTSVDYSPVGLVKTLTKGIRDVAVGNKSSSEFITDLSAGLTGTGIAALGMYLAAQGIITGGEDDDPDRKNALDRAGGFQEYSIRLGNMYFSIDWAAPAVVPLMMGVELFNAIRGNTTDEDTLSIATRVIETMGRAADPIFEMSMLEGIMSALDSYESGAQKASDIAFSAVESYLGQFIPTLFGQLARSVDPVKRSTYSSKDSIYTKSVEQAGRRILAKIPWASKMLEPVIDRTGQETPQISTNGFVRALAQFVSPGNLAFDQFTGVDEELMRLYDVFGETDVLPKTMQSSVTYKNEKYNLSPTEYTAYAARRGTITYSELESLMTSEEYQGMSDEDKHDAVADIIDKGDKEANAAFLNERGVFNYVMQSTNLEKVQHILEQDWTDDQKFAEFTNQMSEKRNEQIQGLLSDGWTQDDIMQGYVKYAELDKTEGLKASAARAELADFMAKRAQKNFMKASEVTKFLEVFNVGTYMPAQAGSYEKLYASGLSTDVAKKVSDKLLALKPLDGSEDVSTAQRLEAIVSSGISAREQWEAMEAYYSTDEGRLNDIEAYKAAGSSAAAYAKSYDAISKIEKEAEKHKDDDTYEGASYYKYKYLAESGMSAADAEAAYKSFMATTDEAIENLKPLEDAGIGYNVIAQFKYKTALLTADKDKNGKSISGSKKDKVLREINALPITAAQKDALYLYAGYSSKDIGKTPWR